MISPLLANVYLHYVFDLWVEAWRRKVARGDVIVVRYADDLVVGFQHRDDAERFLREFRERLAKFGLELHPEKTRLIEFGRFAHVTGNSGERENRRPSRSWASRTTVGNATRAEPSPSGGSLRKSEWLRSSKPSRLSFNAGCMIAWPKSVHGSGRSCWVITNTTLFPGTSTQLRIFKHRVCRLWQSVLVRRSQRARKRWERLTPVLNRWIPPPRVLHPYPDARFYATHPS